MFDENDRKLIFELAGRLTGAAQTGELRHESLAANVHRRMLETSCKTLVEYLHYVDLNPEEHAYLVHSLSIHTTSWFRENPHFVVFQEHLLGALKNHEVFRVWCAACSSGEEVYSFALMLEEFRQVHPGFEYELLGTDIDPVSVAAAQRAVYSQKGANFHLNRYKHHLLLGSGPSEGFFTLSKDIRQRCRFQVTDLRHEDAEIKGPFHFVVCRNVLIYFSPDTVNQIVWHLVNKMRPEGRLLLGHSEAIASHQFGLVQEGHAVYSRQNPNQRVRAPRKPGKYRLLAVDDSLLTRKYFEKIFGDLGFDVFTASSASEATNFLNFNDVDVITLDLNMPDVGGEKWLRDERAEGLRTPVVILSEAHTNEMPAVVRLLALGAQDYVEKSRLGAHPEKVRELFVDLIRASTAPVSENPSSKRVSTPKVRPEAILIGASTGGPQALLKVLESMPGDAPPIVITQHISTKFAKPLAERICEASGLILGEPENGTALKSGHLYMSFGDYHLGIDGRDAEICLRTDHSAPFNGHRPSVDFLFNSALGSGRAIVAVLLTGMGRDGALGLRFLHHEGIFCVAQSEEDCIVYGMPREAVERGAADFVGNLDEIRTLLIKSFQLKAGRIAS